MSNVRAIIEKLKRLAMDEESRPYILRDEGCLPALLLFLKNQDTDVVVMTLETIKLLTEHPANNGIIINYPGLMDRLHDLCQHCSQTIMKMAEETRTLLKASELVNSTFEGKAAAQSSHEESQFSLISSAVAFTFELSIPSMATEFLRKRVETILLSQPGVISFTLDLKQRKGVIRTSVEANEIIKALREGGFVCTIRNEKSSGVISENNENNVNAAFRKENRDVDTKTRERDRKLLAEDLETPDVPQYLDEPQNTASQTPRKKYAMTQYGMETVEGRIAAKKKQKEEEERRKQEKDQKGGGWFSSITRAFW